MARRLFVAVFCFIQLHFLLINYKMVHCYVPGCKNSSRTTKVHVIPKEIKLLEQWSKAIQRNLIDIPNKLRKNFVVCTEHFSEKDKFTVHHNRSNLKASAIPTLKLPKSQREPPELETSELSTFQDSNEDVRKSASSEKDNSADILNLPGTSGLNVKIAEPKTPSKRLDLKRKISLLSLAGVRRASHLSPKAAKLYRTASNLQKIARRLYTDNVETKDRLKQASEYVQSKEYFESYMNSTTVNFLMSQLKLQKKRPRGRRFTTEDKVFALALMKQSPKGYKLLQRVFALPSRKTLMTLLNKIPFNCGINEQIFNVLEQSVKKMDPRNRFCVLLFDEISLESGLSYSKKNDSVNGFVDHGNGKQLQFADHAMVFMVRGIAQKWKQPISFYYTNGAMPSYDIVRNVKSNIRALNKIGLNVVATICDQMSANRKAITQLIEDTKREYAQRHKEKKSFGFEIDNVEVVPLYDPPHLLKQIRNHLLESDAQFKSANGTIKRASWQDIVKLYELDVGEDFTRMCYKLTDQHIYEYAMKKMKVKLAAQVFSHRVASTMNWTVKYGQPNILPPTAEGTAEFLGFFDKLFDSVNSHSIEPDQGKIMRSALTETSIHMEFWTEAIRFLENVKFIKNGQLKTIPSITNWIHTIKGIKYLWGKLKQNFNFLCLRNMNQDPIENLFGSIRSHGVRNVNPTPTQFMNSIKSLIVNNFVAHHSVGANCEIDENDVLNDLKLFVQYDIPQHTAEEMPAEQPLDEEYIDNILNVSTQYADWNRQNNLHSYIAGSLIKRMKKKISNCTVCKTQLLTNESSSEHTFINVLEYKPNLLQKPTLPFLKMFSQCFKLCSEIMETVILTEKVKETLSTNIYYLVHNILKNNCKVHNLKEIFVEHFLNLFIHTYVQHINNVLLGKFCFNIHDKLSLLAIDKYKKNKARRRAIIHLKKINK